MLRSIREEKIVTLTIQRAGYIYPRVWDAYESLCWVLVHQHPSGASIQGANHLYHLHKQAAGGWGVPALTVLYTVSDAVIDVHAIKVG